MASDIKDLTTKARVRGVRAALAGLLASLLSTPGFAATITPVALDGTQLPGFNQTFFAEFSSDPVINNAGDVSFSGVLTGPRVTSNEQFGIFIGTTVPMRSGRPVPGIASATFDFVGQQTSINSSGEVAFFGSFSGLGVDASNNIGIFTQSSLVAREGAVAAGTGGATFSNLDNAATINDAGQVAFSARLAGTDVTPNNDTGIFLDGTLVAREGAVAPGTGGATFGRMVETPDLNNAGEVVFVASLADSGSPIATSSGIFTGSSLIARQGGEAPGTGGATFTSFGLTPTINDSGAVAFVGSFEGAGTDSSNNSGIFADGVLIARKGDPAPGTGGAFFSSLSSPAYNEAGQLAFTAFLTGPGINSLNNKGIFFVDTSGEIQLVAREGDSIDLGGGLQLTPTGLSLSAIGGLNDLGEIAFRASFPDFREGILVAEVNTSLHAVPLPLGLALLPSGLLFLAGWARIGRKTTRRQPAKAGRARSGLVLKSCIAALVLVIALPAPEAGAIPVRWTIA